MIELKGQLDRMELSLMFAQVYSLWLEIDLESSVIYFCRNTDLIKGYAFCLTLNEV